MIELAP